MNVNIKDIAKKNIISIGWILVCKEAGFIISVKEWLHTTAMLYFNCSLTLDLSISLVSLKITLTAVLFVLIYGYN